MAKTTAELYQAATKAAHDKRRKEAEAAQALLEAKAAAWDKVLTIYEDASLSTAEAESHILATVATLRETILEAQP